MADFISQGAFQPSIPKHLINDEDLKILDAFRLTITPDGEEKLFFFADDWCTAGFLENEEGEEAELSEDDLYSCLQGIIRRSNGELTWISRETAYTCTKNRPDGFGGSAIFITADDVQFVGTGLWLEQRILEAETGDLGPETEDSFRPLLMEVFKALTTNKATGESCDLAMLKRLAEIEPSSWMYDLCDLARIAWKIQQAIGTSTNENPNGPRCRECAGNLELTRTDTLLGIDREIYGCPECDGVYIRELASADSSIEKAVKCVGCGNLIVQGTAHIFYQSDDLAHYIGDCCWDERLRS